MIARQRDKIARTETARLTQMYDGSYQDMQRSTSEKFAQDKLGKFKESEHQKVYTQPEEDYPGVENNFTPYDYVPYNPSPFPANGKPKPRRPGKKQGGYENYNCWIQGHCCDNTKGGPIELICTYPFDGPYKKPKSATDVWVRRKPEDNRAIICAKEVTDSSPGNRCEDQFDDLWCMVYGPTHIIECTVFNLVDNNTGFSECTTQPTLCVQLSCTPSITSTTNQLNVGESIQLTATNTCPEKSYYFKLTSGKGKVTKTGLYTAPTSNPGCTSNPTIALVCDCQTVATKTLAVNAYDSGATPAVRTYGDCVAVCIPDIGCTPQAGGYAAISKKAYEYSCNGTVVLDDLCNGCSTGCGGCLCPPIATICANCNCATPVADCLGAAGDIRTPAMIAAGCCPSQLL
jgi:hypothetical protein